MAVLSRGLAGKPQHRRLAEFLQSAGTIEDAFASLRGIFSRAEAARLTQWITGDSAAAPLPASRPMPWIACIGNEVSRLEITRYMRNQLLRDSDVMSMAHGLELRLPMVDRMLFESVATIPAPVRLQHGKQLLTQAVPEVPAWVVHQKKRGFLFPYQQWLAGDWGQAFDESAKGAPVPVTAWYQNWSLFILRQSLANLGLQT